MVFTFSHVRFVFVHCDVSLRFACILWRASNDLYTGQLIDSANSHAFYIASHLYHEAWDVCCFCLWDVFSFYGSQPAMVFSLQIERAHLWIVFFVQDEHGLCENSHVSFDSCNSDGTYATDMVGHTPLFWVGCEENTCCCIVQWLCVWVAPYVIGVPLAVWYLHGDWRHHTFLCHLCFMLWHCIHWLYQWQ